MSDTAAPEVLTEVEDGVLIVTINRPEAKNAMTKAASEAIAAAMDRLDAEDDLRVGILTGAGGTFCSGMDLKGFLRGESPSVPGRGFGGVVQAPPAKPLIAAVEGPDQIPERIAMELALTGDFIGAERAYSLGLINEVTDGSALDGAKALAARIAANGPLAVKVSKQVMKQSRGWAMDERYAKQGELIGPVFVSHDAREGAAAFAEKRKPNWTGK